MITSLGAVRVLLRALVMLNLGEIIELVAREFLGLFKTNIDCQCLFFPSLQSLSYLYASSITTVELICFTYRENAGTSLAISVRDIF